jgi:hypothetical protein
MQRSFGFDILGCPRILRHLQLPEARPTMRPSRDPPLPPREMDDGAVFAE